MCHWQFVERGCELYFFTFTIKKNVQRFEFTAEYNYGIPLTAFISRLTVP